MGSAKSNTREFCFFSGESLLNDGVTIVLYNTMVALGGTSNPQTIEYVTAFFSFFTVVFGGLLIGILVGLLCSYILKVSNSFVPKQSHSLLRQTF